MALRDPVAAAVHCVAHLDCCTRASLAARQSRWCDQWYTLRALWPWRLPRRVAARRQQGTSCKTQQPSVAVCTWHSSSLRLFRWYLRGMQWGTSRHPGRARRAGRLASPWQAWDSSLHASPTPMPAGSLPADGIPPRCAGSTAMCTKRLAAAAVSHACAADAVHGTGAFDSRLIPHGWAVLHPALAP